MSEEQDQDRASLELEDAMSNATMLSAGRDTAESAEPKVVKMPSTSLNPNASSFSFNPSASTWAPPSMSGAQTITLVAPSEDKGKSAVSAEKPATEAVPANEGEAGGADIVEVVGGSGTVLESKIDLGPYNIDEDEEVEEEESIENAAELRNKKHVNIVFIGHVDHGKSTLCGNIMYQTGGLDERTLEKYERDAKQKNRESWKFAYAMDTTDEERDRGKTVEVGRGSFSTENKHFTILDAPGHKSFIPHMIGGAAQADIGVLVISGRKGEFETGFDRGGQTREHTMLAKTSGVRSLIIAVTKMDEPTVNWSEARYKEIVKALKPYLKQVGYNVAQDITFLPISGISGDNITKRVDKKVCPWYSGPSLLEALDELKPPERLVSLPLRMPVHDKYREMGSVVVIGKVQSGLVKKDDKILLMPSKRTVKVLGVYMDSFEIEAGEPGDNIRLKIVGVDDADVHVGDVLCDPDKPCNTAKMFDAQIIILEHKSIISAGYAPVMHIHAIIAEVSLEKLLSLVDRKTNQVIQKRPKFIKTGSTARARFTVERPICIERYKDFQQLGRFMIRDEGKTVGVGVITQLYKVE